MNQNNMRNTIYKIEQFLVSNSVWMFLTLIFFISFLWVMSVPGDTTSIYVNLEKWTLYFKFATSLCLIFLPILLLVGNRNWLKKRLDNKMYMALWLYSFVIHPLLVTQFNLNIFFDSLQFPSEILLVFAFVFFLLEIAIYFNDFLLEKLNIRQYLKKISLEKIIFYSLIFCSITLTFFANAFQEYAVDSSFFKTLGIFLAICLQIFLLLFTFYCFYYANHYFLVERIFKKKGIIYYTFGLFAIILLFVPFIILVLNYLPTFFIFKTNIEVNREIFQTMNSEIIWFAMLISIPFIVVFQWFKQNNEITNLEKEKSDSELNLLKQQINPHFFFNTLNNLYAMSLIKDKQTPEVILQLSELMRYVIYKGKEKNVSLAEEINYIEDYIQLQQIRLHKKLDFKFEKKITDPQIQIPPLLFITFVENAFKHGIEPAEQSGFLHLQLISNEEGLNFTCKNSVEDKIDSEPGIGLKNLKRRLELRFPNEHEISVDEKEHVYLANLKL